MADTTRYLMVDRRLAVLEEKSTRADEDIQELKKDFRSISIQVWSAAGFLAAIGALLRFIAK